MTTKIKLASNVSDVDVTTTAPTNGQGLIYNSTSSKWVPGAAGGGVTVYSTINDLPLSGVSTGDLALVDSTNKLYLWMDTGWYNIATINTNPSITGGYNSSYPLTPSGSAVEITFVASDPEGIPLTWSYVSDPTDLTDIATITNVSNVFTITPGTVGTNFTVTFKASDGVNIGTALVSFEFSVPDSKYTSLLVKALASGANSTFVDSSTNNFTITKNGDVTQGTFSPFSQPEGAWSNYFDGTGDYLSVASGSAFAIGDNDFTIEAWIYASSYSSEFPIIYKSVTWATNLDFALRIDGSTGYARFLAGDNAVINIADTQAIPLNSWVHIAVTRSSGTTQLFVNGAARASTTTALTIQNDATSSYIGKDLSTAYCNGYISNLRVVNGTAITPPSGGPTAPLAAVTGTSLLTCQSNRFVDNSTNGFAITVNGNTSVSPFGPFDRGQYSASIHGGGAYFDGTGDYLTVPASTNWACAGDFSVEAWVYRPSMSGDTHILGTGGSGAADQMVVTSGGNVYWANIGTASNVFTANQWVHIVATRSGSVYRMFINGALKSYNASLSGTIGQNTTMYIGRRSDGSNHMTGYITGSRYINGAIPTEYQTSETVIDTQVFTPPTAPLAAVTNTSLLLNCTNADIIDNDSKNNLKLVGNTSASATRTKYAARSVYFDGTGDYIEAPADALGSGDFTIEMWWNPSTLATTQPFIYHISEAGVLTPAEYVVVYNITLGLRFYTNSGGAGTVSQGNTAGWTTGTWYHVAVVRSGTTLTLYRDGISIASGTNSASLGVSNPMQIGGETYSNAYSTGYIEDLRITKGLARYTANFTPPTSELLG